MARKEQDKMKHHQPSVRRHAKRIKRHLTLRSFVIGIGDENYRGFFKRIHNMQ